MSTSSLTTQSLPRWSENARAFARQVQGLLRTDVIKALTGESQELLGAPLLVSETIPTLVDAGTRNAWPKVPCVAALLDSPHGVLVVELDGFLSACIVDRMLGGEGGKTARYSSAPLREIDKGLLAYFIARTLARVGNGTLSLADVVTSHEAMLGALGNGVCAVWSLRASVGADHGPVRVLASDSLLANIPPHVDTTSLKSLPVECVATLGTATLLLSEIASLSVGDSIVLDEGRFEHAWVSAADNLTLLCECKIEQGTLRVLRAHKGGSMNTTVGSRHKEEEDVVTATDVSLRHVQDIPVTLTAELARFTVPYVELATLGVGDVLRTGRPITELVTLRAGTRTIANAELVDVDGELGVRILQIVDRA